MKFVSTFIALIVLTITTAIASDKNTLAVYRFATVDHTQGYSSFEMPTTVYEVTLKKNGVLSTKATLHNSENGSEPVTKTTEKKLSAKAMNLLLEDVIALSTAEIKTKYSAIVCMMMPSPEQSNDHLSVARNYDYESKSFKGKLEFVSGPKGCWLHQKTSLKNSWENERAEVLKRSLVLLSL